MDEEIFSTQVQVERKVFSFALRQNRRGRFLRIVEDVGGRQDIVIVPSPGLRDIRDALDKAIAADQKAGPAPSMPPT